MAKFGGIYEMDYHDFYSQVGWDISKAKKRYDSSKGKSFKDYIHGVIKLSVCKEDTHVLHLLSERKAILIVTVQTNQK